MPRDNSIKKVLVIGSGPIVIGQAAEFDYAGTQACRSLKEEGIEVVLLNSNPATIMTDKDIADEVYIEPLTPEVIKKLILKVSPDSLLPTLGGQAALNIAMELDECGFLKEHKVKLIGTTGKTIRKAEDREEFKETMEKIGEPIAPSQIVTNVEDGLEYAQKIGYPVVLRPAYTLGGSGGGIADNEEEFVEIIQNGLRLSRVGQVLVEKSIAGWKEIEYEVMRDGNGTCITVCNMENLDPVGVHTGDSIVVAPSQTLGDKEYQMLRNSALNIIDELGVEGGCNVQFALNPDTFDYCVIEVNPRVSRSSALASKATGYPIAKVTAKIALGYHLDEIKNAVTGKTFASFEPALDYCVVKVPRLPFDKFISASRHLTTQMKATGEVMSICTNFEGGLMKALRSLEQHVDSLMHGDFDKLSDKELEEHLHIVDDLRIYCIAEALRRKVNPQKIHDITKIDLWFIDKLNNIVEMEAKLKNAEELDRDLLLKAKEMEFPDKVIGELIGQSEEYVKNLRRQMDIVPAYKVVDTCAAEFAAETPYYYSCFGSFNEVEETSDKKKIMVLGSGPIRIGQGIEFDYCCVHAAIALKELGFETIIVNCNPETVSTDYDTSDKLYFEPLTLEDVLSIYHKEKPLGVIAQFGGQTPLNLAADLKKYGVNILGTTPETIDMAEDRDLFRAMMDKLQIPMPESGMAVTVEDALEIANKIGYPVMVRPSYVLGGRGMEVVHDDEAMTFYMRAAVGVTPDRPILIDRFLHHATECEADAISDGENVFVPAVMEHIELAGIHSGDSACILPSRNLTKDQVETIRDYTSRIAKEMHVVGLMNMQYAIEDGEVYVLEANPRASRTVPLVSKVCNIKMVKLATDIMTSYLTGRPSPVPALKEKKIPHYGVKMPVFPFKMFPEVDPVLGPEMRSTGEVLGMSTSVGEAIYKAQEATQTRLPSSGTVLLSVNDKDKIELIEVARGFYECGFTLMGTGRTCDVMVAAGLPAEKVCKINEGRPNILDKITNGEVAIIINTPNDKKGRGDDSYIRKAAVKAKIPYFTNMAAAKATVQALRSIKKNGHLEVKSLQEFHSEIQ